MGERCDICLEETCGGLRNCDCNNCKQFNECSRVLRPTIRITTKCTQSCRHCCYSCSPKADKMMSLETASHIRQFMINNKIKTANIMGGEFFCNPNWKIIISVLIKDLQSARLVSNGDWAENKEIALNVVDLLKSNLNLKLSLSFDQWHTNKNIQKAVDWCEEFEINYNVATKEDAREESIVPIGKQEYEFNYYSMFGCYCTKPDRKYHFLIDEDGEIYKCPFGIWNYADVISYKDDFRERFKEFHGIFYKSFIMNCAECIRSHKRLQKENKL